MERWETGRGSSRTARNARATTVAEARRQTLNKTGGLSAVDQASREWRGRQTWSTRARRERVIQGVAGRSPQRLHPASEEGRTPGIEAPLARQRLRSTFPLGTVAEGARG